MVHPIPKELEGEERVLSISWLDLHLNKTGVIYNGIATLFSGLIFWISNNVILLIIVLLISNIAVYPLAQTTIRKTCFDGGNVRRDIYLKRKFKYKKNLYLKKC